MYKIPSARIALLISLASILMVSVLIFANSNNDSLLALKKDKNLSLSELPTATSEFFYKIVDGERNRCHNDYKLNAVVCIKETQVFHGPTANGTAALNNTATAGSSKNGNNNTLRPVGPTYTIGNDNSSPPNADTSAIYSTPMTVDTLESFLKSKISSSATPAMTNGTNNSTNNGKNNNSSSNSLQAPLNSSSSSSLQSQTNYTINNMAGIQVGDGQEIDSGSEEQRMLSASESESIKANLVIPDSSPFKSDQCTPVGSLEKFVPNPFMKDINTTRFIVGNCVIVTGKVTWTHYINTDGDANFNIKLDSKYGSLLTPANMNSKKLKGTLHVEVVCQGKNKSTDPVKINQCKDPKYDGPYFKKSLPEVGKKVQVTGIYVIDVREGAHAELHPVYHIK